MNKDEFLKALKGDLSDLRVSDVDEIIAYFDEMIEDKKDEGLSEEEIIKGLSSPREIALVLKGQDEKGNSEKTSEDDEYLVYQTEGSTLNEIVIDDVFHDIKVSEGDDDFVTFIYPKEDKYLYRIKNKGQKLKISRNDDHFFSAKIFKERKGTKLILPKGYGDSLKVETVSGNTTISDVNLAFLKIESVSGSVDLERVFARTGKVEVVSGDLRGDELRGKEFKVEMVSGKARIEALQYDFIKIETVSGNVDIEIEGKEEDYAISYEKILKSYKIREELKQQKYLKLEAVMGEITYRFMV